MARKCVTAPAMSQTARTRQSAPATSKRWLLSCSPENLGFLLSCTRGAAGLSCEGDRLFFDGQAGMIVDDELNRLLVNPLPPGTRLHVVIGVLQYPARLQASHTASAASRPLSIRNLGELKSSAVVFL